ncbi:MAG: tetratricopeptide repeat protein [bacterium]|nr:tetratricopeptide repeat protein [Candidatus Sumerlaeota bacterium]
MNADRDRVDDLLELARDYLESGEKARALDVLREANAIAPLRSEVRELIAFVLSEPSCEQNPRHSAAAIPERRSSDETADDYFRPDPPTHPVEHTRSQPEQQVLSAAFAAREEYRQASEFKETILDKHPARSPQPYALSAGEDHLASNNLATDEGEDDFEEAPMRQESMFDRADPSMRTRWITYAAIYGFIIMFISTASAYSYYVFFRAPSGEQKSWLAQAADSFQKTINRNAPASKTEEEMLNLAKSYLDEGRHDDGIKLLGNAAKNSKTPGMRERVNEQLALIYNAKGTSLLTNSKVVESLAFYEKAAEIKPNRADFALLLGNAYYYCASQPNMPQSRAYYEKARDAISRSLELDRNNVKAYQRLATVYEGLNQSKQARAMYDQIIKIAPSSTEAQEAERRIKTLSMAN